MCSGRDQLPGPDLPFADCAIAGRFDRRVAKIYFCGSKCSLFGVKVGEDLLLLFHKSPAAALRLLAAMSQMTRKADELLRTRVSRNANEEAEEKGDDRNA